MEDEEPSPIHPRTVRYTTDWWERSINGRSWHHDGYKWMPGPIERGQCIEIAERFKPVTVKQIKQARRKHV